MFPYSAKVGMFGSSFRFWPYEAKSVSVINLKRSLPPKEVLIMFPEQLSWPLTHQMQILLVSTCTYRPQSQDIAFCIVYSQTGCTEEQPGELKKSQSLRTSAIPALWTGLQYGLCTWSVKSSPVASNVQPSMRIQVLINHVAIFLAVLFPEGKVFIFSSTVSFLVPSWQHSSQSWSITRKPVKHFIEVYLAHNTLSSVQKGCSLFCSLHPHSPQSGRNMVHNE